MPLWWTKEENTILEQYYGKATREALEVLLPNRTWTAIVHKASRLKKKRTLNSFFNPVRVPNLSCEDVLYLAGLFDGEGSFTLNKRRERYCRFCPGVLITNTSRELIEWVAKTIGCTYAHINLGPNEKLRKWKPAYRISLTRTLDIKAFSEQILPYLKAKKRQAELLLEYCNAQLEREWSENDPRLLQIYHELRTLNRKGRRRE